MEILRIKNISKDATNVGTLYLNDCGVKCDHGSDQVLKATQAILASIGGGIAERFIKLGHLRVFVLYKKVWLPVEYPEVMICQNNELWEIRIKQYDIA